MIVQKHTKNVNYTGGIHTPDHNPVNYLRIQAINPNLQDFEQKAIKDLINELDPENDQNCTDQDDFALNY